MIKSFPHSYKWRLLGGFPNDREILNFPPGIREYSEGYVVEIILDNNVTWVGNYHGVHSEYLTGVFPAPNKDSVCIVTDGVAFLVNTISPLIFSEVPINPVIEVITLVDQGLLLIIDFFRIAAIDINGIRWITNVSEDGIKITDINNERIIGIAWDPTKGGEVKFEVNLLSGNYLGGSNNSFSPYK